MNELEIAQKEFGILDRVTEGVCVLREDFRVVFWNRSLEDWTGISRSKILGTDISIYFPHLRQPKYFHRLEQIFFGGPPTIFSSLLHKSIIPCQLPDGRWRIQHTTVTAVPAPDVTLENAGSSSHTQSFYALFVIEDVTDLTHRIQEYRAMRDRALEEIEERKKIEAALQESQYFIKKIADAAPYILYIHDLVKWRNIYINQQVGVILGYTVSEIQQMGEQVLYQLMHPDDFTQLPAHFRKFANAQDGDIIELEYRMQHRSGEWRWLLSREIVFARTPEGLPKEILGTAQDISDRKKAEEAMRLQAERERLLGAIAQHIRQSLDLGEVLQTAVTEVRQFLHAERAIVFRFQYCANNDTDPVKEAVVTVESVADDCRSILGETIPSCCINANYCGYYQNYTIRNIENINNADAPECHIKTIEKWGAKSSLEVPIWQKEKLWGLMMIHQCKGFRQWQTWEIDLIEQLANQLAIAIQQAELYQKLQAANQELERLASSDGLTQLANRRRFDQYLAKEWRRLEREQAPLSLIMCDVDFFKIYNDTYGHQAGDSCLQEVAAALTNAVKRPADLVARYGGEEFAVILPRTEVEGAYQVAEKIRTSVLELKIPHAGSPMGKYITISLGVAGTIPLRGFPPAELITMADMALYQAKQAGRDRVVCLSLKSATVYKISRC